jgi:hypothetical protein
MHFTNTFSFLHYKLEIICLDSILTLLHLKCWFFSRFHIHLHTFNYMHTTLTLITFLNNCKNLFFLLLYFPTLFFYLHLLLNFQGQLKICIYSLHLVHAHLILNGQFNTIHKLHGILLILSPKAYYHGHSTKLFKIIFYKFPSSLQTF